MSTANDEGRGPETPRSVDRGGRPIGEDRRQRRFSLRRLSSSPGTESTTAGPSTATAATVLGPLNGQDLQWAPSSSQQPLSGFRRVASVLRPTPPSATLDASLLLAMKCRPRPGSFSHQESMKYLGNRPLWPYTRTPSLWGPRVMLVTRAGHSKRALSSLLGSSGLGVEEVSRSLRREPPPYEARNSRCQPERAIRNAWLLSSLLGPFRPGSCASFMRAQAAMWPRLRLLFAAGRASLAEPRSSRQMLLLKNVGNGALPDIGVLARDCLVRSMAF